MTTVYSNRCCLRSQPYIGHSLVKIRYLNTPNKEKTQVTPDEMPLVLG